MLRVSPDLPFPYKNRASSARGPAQDGPRDAPGSSLNKDRDALPRHEYARMAGHMGMFEAKDQVYGFIGSSPAAGLDPRSEPVSMT